MSRGGEAAGMFAPEAGEGHRAVETGGRRRAAEGIGSRPSPQKT